MTLNLASNWRDVSHLRVSIRIILPTCLIKCSFLHEITIAISISDWLNIILLVFVNFAQSTIKSVLLVLGNWSEYPRLVPIGRLETLWNVSSVTSVVPSVNLVLLAPPLWVNDRVQACGTGSFLLALMRIVDLKPLLGAISWDSVRGLL